MITQDKYITGLKLTLKAMFRYIYIYHRDKKDTQNYISFLNKKKLFVGF